MLLSAIITVALIEVTSAVESIAKRKCDEFYPDRGSGVGQFLEVSSGVHEDAAPNEFPYMAIVGSENEDGIFTPGCGGVLIDPKYVLCPAYCVSPMRQSWKAIAVFIGKTDISNPQSLNGKIVANRTIIHPEWKKTEAYNQLALVELKESASQHPVCLWAGEIDLIQHTRLFYNRESRKLWKTPATVVSNDECSKYYTSRKLPKGISSSQMCAKEGNEDDFRLSSSGPLIGERLEGKVKVPYVVALSNQAIGGEAPVLFSKIPSYIDWISSTIWPSA